MLGDIGSSLVSQIPKRVWRTYCMPNDKDQEANALVGAAVLTEARLNPAFESQLRIILKRRIRDMTEEEKIRLVRSRSKNGGE